MSYELADVERELCRIPEVRAARIVADLDGRPVEVHVLASPGKHAKQVVRDIQSVAMATVGLSIDHRIVSVVQLEDLSDVVGEPADEVAGAPASEGTALGVDDVGGDEEVGGDRPQGAPVDEDGGAGEGGGGDVAGVEAPEDGVPAAGPPAATATNAPTSDSARARSPRILVERVLVLRRGVTCTAEVVLRSGDEVVTGDADGSGASSAVLRLVADATLAALCQLRPAAERAYVETASVARVNDHEVAMTTVVIVDPPNEELVSGSAPVRGAGEHDAIARSMLDALDRRLRDGELTSP